MIAMAGDPKDFKGIFLVRIDSGIKVPADLKGKAVSYPSPTALAACIMPQYFYIPTVSMSCLILKTAMSAPRNHP